jgi:hypothetical protein
LRIIREHRANLEVCKSKLENAIACAALHLTPHIKLISTVPGVKILSALIIFGVIGVDMSVFKTSNICDRGQG